MGDIYDSTSDDYLHSKVFGQMLVILDDTPFIRH